MGCCSRSSRAALVTKHCSSSSSHCMHHATVVSAEMRRSPSRFDEVDARAISPSGGPRCGPVRANPGATSGRPRRRPRRETARELFSHSRRFLPPAPRMVVGWTVSPGAQLSCPGGGGLFQLSREEATLFLAVSANRASHGLERYCTYLSPGASVCARPS